GQSQSREQASSGGFGGITQGFECWKPIIAAINGHCFAGGFEIMLACDLRIASENAVFGQTEVRWGIIPGAGGTQRLPRAIPLAHRAAKQAMLQGLSLPLDDGMKLERKLFASLLQTEDAREGPLAFAQKRKPNFKGK